MSPLDDIKMQKSIIAAYEGGFAASTKEARANLEKAKYAAFNSIDAFAQWLSGYYSPNRRYEYCPGVGKMFLEGYLPKALDWEHGWFLTVNLELIGSSARYTLMRVQPVDPNAGASLKLDFTYVAAPDWFIKLLKAEDEQGYARAARDHSRRSAANEVIAFVESFAMGMRRGNERTAAISNLPDSDPDNDDEEPF